MSAIKRSVVKDPDVDRFITFDWSDWLDSGETISSGTIEAPSGDLTVLGSATNDDTTVSVEVSGGILGEDYDVTCTVSTSLPRDENFTGVVRIEET